MTQDEIKTVQQEYDCILELIGLKVVKQKKRLKRSLLNLQQVRNSFQLVETNDAESLINLVRNWYHIWLRDPDLADNDAYVLPEIWEYKLELLKKRASKLYQKILRPLHEETRLDDYVKQLVLWLSDRFKQARSEWQEPVIIMEQVVHKRERSFIQFSLNYYVDDIRLEDGARGIRVNSDIHREIMRHLKDSFI